MSSTIRILGLDPGLRRTGWGIIDYSGNELSYVSCGVVSPPTGESMPDRLLYLHDGLSSILSEHSPHEAAIETVFVGKNVSSTLKLGEARGICEFTPAKFGLSVSEYSPTKIKKSLVGFGRGGKSQIESMVKMLLPRAQWQYNDSADALAIAICHAHHR